MYALYALYCLVISARVSGTALGLNPAGDPVFRNHAPPCSTGLFHGIPVHPNIYGFAFYALYAL